ncbi:hypothetical protein H7827_14680 [Streptomyces sp. JH002]
MEAVVTYGSAGAIVAAATFFPAAAHERVLTRSWPLTHAPDPATIG